MIKIVSRENAALVDVTDEDGNELKNIVGVTIYLQGRETPKAILEVVKPIVSLYVAEEYKIMDLSIYPTKYLVELNKYLDRELKNRGVGYEQSRFGADLQPCRLGY